MGRRAGRRPAPQMGPEACITTWREACAEIWVVAETGCVWLLLWCGRPACTGGRGAARRAAVQAGGLHHKLGRRPAPQLGLRPAPRLVFAETGCVWLLLWCGRPACTGGGEAARRAAVQAGGPHHKWGRRPCITTWREACAEIWVVAETGCVWLLLWCGRPACTGGGERPGGPPCRPEARTTMGPEALHQKVRTGSSQPGVESARGGCVIRPPACTAVQRAADVPDPYRVRA